ncbi:DNA-directed RNA polymerase III subunit RPC8-like isoform X6 [Salvia hispanica]|uniref:DNA-directed RNA polymerase III subunit RPC8-like isoform X6 n=1 Tax=Salvia hispanica TaxID=49212 RepID=UPI0020091E36|nr:DNA-directed RNA polymerase III subunit RPC8-like isoform X6 [Salvia hispanica]
MFFLSQIEHSLMLPPHLLNRPLGEAIKEQLDSIFLDKVIDKLGLCVSVYDIRSISGGFILPGDGASTYTEKFRLVFFRPFVGEIITAWLKESTMDALRCIYCRLVFFMIYMYLSLCCSLLTAVNWTQDIRIGLLGSGIIRMKITEWMERMRFQVHDVRYPPIPLEPKDVKPFAPMVVTGSLDMDGVGPSSWWV